MSLNCSSWLLKSSGSFRRLLQNLQQTMRAPNQQEEKLLVFAVSSNAPDAENIAGDLASIFQNSVGCLSAPLPLKAPHPFFSCSLAIVDRKCCIPFKVERSSDAPIQVGRWHSFRKKNAVEVDDMSSLEGLLSKKKGSLWEGTSSSLPGELNEARYVAQILWLFLSKPLLTAV